MFGICCFLGQALNSNGFRGFPRLVSRGARVFGPGLRCRLVSSVSWGPACRSRFSLRGRRSLFGQGGGGAEGGRARIAGR